MKNLKLNKLAENRLNEKEMRALEGGLDVLTIMCPKDEKECECCHAICSCLVFGQYSNTIASTGDSRASSVMRPYA